MSDETRARLASILASGGAYVLVPVVAHELRSLLDEMERLRREVVSVRAERDAFWDQRYDEARTGAGRLRGERDRLVGKVRALEAERDRLLSERNPMHVSLEAQLSAALCALQNVNNERDLCWGVVEAARAVAKLVRVPEQGERLYALKQALATLDASQGKPCL